MMDYEQQILLYQGELIFQADVCVSGVWDAMWVPGMAATP